MHEGSGNLVFAFVEIANNVVACNISLQEISLKHMSKLNVIMLIQNRHISESEFF